MRALVTFTVAESKALIAKAVVKHPIVTRALAEHTVILSGGTTNAFVLIGDHRGEGRSWIIRCGYYLSGRSLCEPC